MSPRKRQISVFGLLDTHTNLKNNIVVSLERYKGHFESLAESVLPVTDICIVIENDRAETAGLYIIGETEDGFVVLKFTKSGNYDLDEDARYIYKNVLADEQLEPDIDNIYTFFPSERNSRASKEQVSALMSSYLTMDSQSQLLSASAVASHLGDASELFVDRVLRLSN